MKSNFTFFLLLLLFNTASAQFTDSNLPIVIITTDIDPGTGQPADIPDDPKVLASMKVIYRPDGSRNYVTDQNNPAFLNYDGRIGIELRGTSSQFLQKKPYGLTTLLNDNISNNNVSILNMPAENDWVLNSLAYDETLMRDYLTYDLARSMGNYAARGRYCEVVINGDYKGLYIFLEKLKIDSARINILKMTALDNSLPNVTGGYITKCDKTTGGDPVAWSFPTILGNENVNFIHDNPKPANITPQQHNYIFNEFSLLESIAQNQNSSIVDGFPSKIDVPTFVDFMILNEFSSNVDGYQYSTFFHKDRNGKLRAGPIWDFNFTYGLDFFGDRSKTDVWQFNNGDNVGATFWWDFFNNAVFKCYLVRRWNELTAVGNPLNYAVIENRIDVIANLLAEARVRENARWSSISDYTARVNEMKSWIQTRTAWLNANIGTTATCTFPTAPALVISKIHYNPVIAGGFASNDLEFIELTNNSLSNIDVSGYYFRELGITFIFPNNSILTPGSKIYLASNATAFSQFYGFAPFGVFTRNLSNKSEKLVLADPYGNIVDFVEYADSSPWPVQADGTGAYLRLINLNSDNSLASSWTTSNQGTLPVRLLSFTGKANNGINQLKWQTAGETNNAYFNIERSGDGRSFKKIGMIAGAGNSSVTKSYEFNDDKPLPDISYYRLEQVDIDGGTEFSHVIAIKNENSRFVSVYPNPTRNQLYVEGIKDINAVYTIKNTTGQTVLKGSLSTGNIINVEALSKGLYYILIEGKALKFIKQ